MPLFNCLFSKHTHINLSSAFVCFPTVTSRCSVRAAPFVLRFLRESINSVILILR